MAGVETKEKVPEHFDRVARSYDFLTGMNPGYRRHLRMSAARMGVTSKARILDLCCGTGLSTEAIRLEYPAAEITGLDASVGMLALARAKKRLDDCSFVEGDAMDPAASGLRGPFDAIFMAYGIRNMADPDVCLANLRALLAPGGVLCVHEYSLGRSPLSRAVWNAVSLGIIIPGGVLASGSADLYRYLRTSVLEFDDVPDFEARLARAGFSDVRTGTMDGWQRGIVHTFVARNPR